MLILFDNTYLQQLYCLICLQSQQDSCWRLLYMPYMDSHLYMNRDRAELCWIQKWLMDGLPPSHAYPVRESLYVLTWQNTLLQNLMWVEMVGINILCGYWHTPRVHYGGGSMCPSEAHYALLKLDVPLCIHRCLVCAWYSISMLAMLLYFGSAAGMRLRRTHKNKKYNLKICQREI